MNLKELLKSLLAAGFASVEQKAQVKDLLDKASDAEKAELGADAEAVSGLPEESEEIDKEGLKALIAGEVDKMSETIANNLVKKFTEGVAVARKKALDVTAPHKDNTKGNDTVREFFKALVEGDSARIKTLSTSTSDTPKAGYTIPTELLAEVLRFANVYGVARADMRYLPFSGPGNTRNIPTLGSSVTVNWTNEKAAKLSTEPGFGIVAQTLKKLTAIVPLTEELLEDSAIDFKSLIGELVGEAISKEEDTQFLAGTGSPWTGVLNNASANILTLAAGKTFALVTADDMLDLQDKLSVAAKRNAKYYMHPTMLSVMRKLKAATTGEYIYQQPSGNTPATLWGKPVVETDVLPAVTDTALNKKFVIFGDLKKCAILGDKQQIQVKILDQATITDTDGTTPINLAEQDEVALRFVERVGYVLGLPSGIAVMKTNASAS